MKQSPSRINADTLGDLISLRNAGMVGGLNAWCYWGPCGRGAVPIDLDRLARKRGLNYEWKQLKPVCKYCAHRDRNVGLSILWTDMSHVSGNMGYTPPSPGISHNGPPPEPIKTVKKRRRKKSGFTWKPEGS